MSRRPARVTQADISRALRAASQVGANVAVDILPDGTIRIIPAEAVTEQNKRKQVAYNPEIVL